jgi:alpha-tubulin suppressor-like RCC1 family protein
MSPVLPGVLVLAPGYGHTCASTASATFCWGSNAQAQLGNGGTTDSLTPVMPTSAPVFGAMAAYNHTCGIDKTSAGAIYCWGNNGYGQVGDGTMTDRTAPAAVGANGVQIAVSPYHTCMVATSDVIYCWGRGSEGQLGLGDFAGHASPQPVPQTVTGLCTAVATGWYHTCAIGTNGRLYCWGGNQFGQLGQGDGAFRNTPIVVGSATWKSVAAGLGHTCGVHSDGTLWCWGRNTRGQLGLGSYDDRYVPGHVGQDTDWRAVYAGDEHTCGVKTSGQVLCWGGNEEGQTPDATAWTATMVRVP